MIYKNGYEMVDKMFEEIAEQLKAGDKKNDL